MEKDKKELPRRQFITNISKASALGLMGSILPVSANAAAIETFTARPSEGHIFLSKPYLQVPSSDSMTIRWITNKLCYSWLEYGEGNNLNKKMHQVTDGLVNAHNRINSVTLQDLKANSAYSYRVVSKEIISFEPYKLEYGETIMSDTYSFMTLQEKAEEVSWLIMNDIHDRPHSIAQLLKLNKDDSYDYVFFNGDVFDYQKDEKQIIDNMLNPCTEAFASTKPFFFVRGNHETRGKYARELKNYFSTKGDKGYYAYEWGPVFNIVLDTGEDKPDDHQVYGGIVDFDDYRKEQKKWVEEVMRSKAFKKAKFRVVMMHIPHFHSDEEHGTMHCRQLFAPLFEQYKVDVVISGHTHTYGVHPPTSDHSYPIIIGGGPKEGNRTLIKVKADMDGLNVSMLKDDGTEVGKYFIESKR